MREEEEELEGTQEEALPSCLNQPQWWVDIIELVSLQRLKYNAWDGPKVKATLEEGTR